MDHVWLENRRADGLRLAQAIDGNWFVTTRDGAMLSCACPCCDKPFKTAHAARLVADKVYATHP